MAEKKKKASSAKKNTSVKKGSAASGKKSAASKAAPKKVTKSHALLGLVITVFTAVLFLLLLVVDDMALLGDFLRPLFMGLIGFWGMAMVPLYLVNLIRTWYRDRKADKVAAKWCFSAFNFLFALLIFHWFTSGDALKTFNGNMWAEGKAGVGCGVIGGYVYAAMNALMGKVATGVLLWLAFLVTLPPLFDTTPIRVIRAVARGMGTVTTQVAVEDDFDEEETEIAAAPVKNVGRDGVELRTPVDKDKQSDKKKKKRAILVDDDDLPEDEIVPLTKQIEINRTKGRGRDEERPKDYKEIFADDGVRMPADARDTAPYESAETQLVEEEAPFNVEPVTEAPTVTPAEEIVVSDNEEAEPEQAEPEQAEAVEIEVEKLKSENAPYMFPPLNLLAPKENGGMGMSLDESRRTSELLIDTLATFGVGAKLINTSHGPTVTRFELQPDTGVRVKKISNLSEDIALHLAATSVRIEAPIPGKSAVGIEIPNKNKSIVRLRELLEDYGYKNAKGNLLCCLGMDVVGNPVHLDVSKMPHLLIAGATGMGKSVCINSLIVSLLYRARPDEVKLILIDPKKVEFTDYNGIPHLLVPVVTEPKKAAGSLNWAVLEMERRFSEIQEVGARNLEEYNEFTADDPEKEYIPQIVIVIDELADLMMTAPSEVENSICRLAQKARAAGMYLIIGTQRPSVDVITGLIKANIPSRIACKVASQIDSRTILDIAGAERLLGKGDMLYYPVGATKPLRVQGAFVEGREVISVCTYLKQAAEAHYSEDVMQMIEKEAQLCGEKGSKRAAMEAESDDNGSIDPLELDAIEVGIECESISTSLLQRRLSIGYARAARIIDKLEQKGIVSAYDSALKKRTVIISRDALAQMRMNAIDGGGGKNEG